MDAAKAKTRKEKILQTAVSTGNIQRCFYTALLFAVLTPVVLILLSAGGAKKTMEPYVIPGVFFAVFSAAFVYFLYHAIKVKAKAYYGVVSGIYLAFLLGYFVYFARLQYSLNGGLLFYYAAVLLGAYVVHTSFSQYAALCVLELFGLLFVTAGKSSETEVLTAAAIGMEQLLQTMAVYLFAFLLSRECYQARRKVLLDEQKLKCGMLEAERDPLTGLMNRRGLEHAVNLVWSKCVRNQELIAAMIIDIDHFKQYNDKFGHVEGDACIRRVAQSIAATAHGIATVARIGGEEFFVFARGISEEEVLELAESIRLNIEGMRIPHASRESVVTVSIGVDMETAGEDSSFLGLYGRADKKLYQAKQEGRNRVESNCSRGKKYHRIG
ncbi:MAG: GGDEF domain-containing protein [Lachnospiraceae bacterium]